MFKKYRMWHLCCKSSIGRKPIAVVCLWRPKSQNRDHYGINLFLFKQVIPIDPCFRDLVSKSTRHYRSSLNALSLPMDSDLLGMKEKDIRVSLASWTIVLY
jgi:hypothetical protein